MDWLQVSQNEVDFYQNGGKLKVLEFKAKSQTVEYHFPSFPLDKLAKLIEGKEEEEALYKTWSDYQLEVEQFLLLTGTLVNSANAYITYSNLLNKYAQPDMFIANQIMNDARTLELRLQSMETVLLKAYTLYVKYFPIQEKYVA